MKKTALTKVRRQNREVTDDAWIRRKLTIAATGVLAVSSDNQPYAHANLFVYDDPSRTIYFHTAAAGRLHSCVENNPKASFIIFEMGRLLPGPHAKDFSVEYANVVVYGSVTIVTNPAEIMNTLQKYFSKYASHITAEEIKPYSLEDAQKTTVYKLSIAEWSGKEHREPQNFLNAYHYSPIMKDSAWSKII